MGPLHLLLRPGGLSASLATAHTITRVLLELGADVTVTAADRLCMRALEVAPSTLPLNTDAVALLLAADDTRRRNAATSTAAAATPSARLTPPLPPLPTPRWCLDMHGRPSHCLALALTSHCVAVLRAALAAGVRLTGYTAPILGVGHLPLLAAAVYAASPVCVEFLLSLKGEHAVDVNEPFNVRSMALLRDFDNRGADGTPAFSVVALGGSLPPMLRGGDNSAPMTMTALDLQAAMPLLQAGPPIAARSDAVRDLLVAAGARTYAQTEEGKGAAAKAAPVVTTEK